ncbi:hypothetical protein CFAM422_001960 [Trichoderma lentiforme]|uniref:Uncharacterized protein n=1 Tax=Trichoderma lentiforme TaxID=1567552 RepID=A0A9P5CI46_9HYPO|nr:hypothetical protein CFAM422_001960 [Trichoderma lentiforme]
MYRSAGCGLEEGRGRDGGMGQREAYQLRLSRATGGHEATAASGEMATAARKRAARAGGGQVGDVEAMDEVEDGESGNGNEMFDGWRFRPDSRGVG